MNTAATASFIAVMILGMTGLTALVWRDRRRTTPAPIRAASIYDDTVDALGDPTGIDTDPPACPPWPEYDDAA